MSHKDFIAESNRKDQLLTLLTHLEEATLPASPRKTDGLQSRSKSFSGTATVTKIGRSYLQLRSENGKNLGNLAVTPEIASLCKLQDQWGVTLSMLDGQWFLTQIQFILSPLKGTDKVSCSIRNPATLPLLQ